MAELKIDDATMTGLVTKALVEGLSGETKEKLITEAIKEHLLKKPEKQGHWGPEPRSPLQVAFNSAAEHVARQVCQETLTADPAFRARVKKLYTDAVGRLFDTPDQYEALVSKLSGAINQAMTKLNE